MPAEVTLEGFAQAIEKMRAIPERVQRQMALATERNCQELVAKIKDGIITQAPGGVPFAPLHPYTILARLASETPKRREQLIANLAAGGEAKALINHGDLLRAITYKVDGLKGVVGVNRKAVTQDGKSMVNLAEVLFGGKTIQVTPRMRIYLAATGLALKASTTHISIPARDPILPSYRAIKEKLLDRYKAALQTGITGKNEEG